MKKVFIILGLLQLFIISNAQNWIHSRGIEDKLIRSIISYSGDTLLAGVDSEGIYISYDKGANWDQFALNGESIMSLIKVDNAILAGTYGNDLYKATSLKSQWEHISINSLVIESLKFYNDTIFSCTWMENGGIYFSSDNGNSWSKYGSRNLTALNIDFSPNGRRFVSDANGMYYSDYNSGWISTTGFGGTVKDVIYLGNDSVLYCCDMDGLYLSTDNGVSVQKYDGFNNYGMGFYSTDDLLYVLSVDDLLYTSSLNSNWQSTGLEKNVITLIEHEEKLIAGTGSGIYIKTIASSIPESYSTFNNLSVFPNPTKDLLQIKNINSDSFLIEITNSNGQLVKTVNASVINISELKSGLYFYKIMIDKYIYTGKVIKE